MRDHRLGRLLPEILDHTSLTEAFEAFLLDLNVWLSDYQVALV